LIRVKGLDHRLTPHEFGRALYHINKRRGYKDIGEKNKETKKQIKRRSDEGFEEAMLNNRSVGEALLNAFLEEKKRARNQYPYRYEYLSEFEKICQTQSSVLRTQKDRDFIIMPIGSPRP